MHMASTDYLPIKGEWINLINESVHTVDDINIADIDARIKGNSSLFASNIVWQQGE